MQVTVFPGLITECRSHFYSIRSYKVRGLSSISVLVRLPRVRYVQRRLRINEEILEILEMSVSQQSRGAERRGKRENYLKIHLAKYMSQCRRATFNPVKFESIDTFTDSQFEFTELDSPAFDISYPSSKLKYLLGYGLHIREDSNRRAITGSEKSSQGRDKIISRAWLCTVPGDLLALNTSNHRRVIDTSAKLLIRSGFDCPETHRGYYIYWIPIEI
ncbi:LOW QUALITY PROTEIN: hypothetical protein V1478_016494 [Vespula squamosa]|uniref:Uncharacterized protein n=1 Tax=Vespula squamosa TaxID=30214 RepID=A0ABD2A0H2_VESSQ